MIRNIKLKVYKTGIACLVTIMVTFSACKTNSTGKSKELVQPNIIYILADDLGYGELGCYGQEKIETPLNNVVISHLRFE
ncbi:hypothetical protein [Carboxylicivirga sp. M1479]|uniref:hypothetical protein n=1 Tax=Carboxylicivirga sp. M1479 TaxID=2594476 RepID=UPI0011773534|nr:hypothetical protein [Carboxylicivirga sp. M1479]TRX60463.1 hypothetical protein FNN09_20625 [Carboxylicivirga sp. M1479]